MDKLPLLSRVKVEGCAPAMISRIKKAADAVANSRQFMSKPNSVESRVDAEVSGPKMRALSVGEGLRGVQDSKIVSNGFPLLVIITS